MNIIIKIIQRRMRRKKPMPNDSMRLTDKEFDILIKLVNKHYNALKEINNLESGQEQKMSFFKTLSAKLSHTKVNGICAKRVEVNATSLVAKCGDKEVFVMDLIR
jgi:hypothetical protein